MPNNIKPLKLRDGSEFYPQIISGCIPNGAIDASKLNSDLMNLLNSKANANDVYTKTQVYNTSEIDTLLSVKANATDVYTKSYIDALMLNYYTKTQIDQFLNQIYDVHQVNYDYQETSGTLSSDSEEYSRLLNNPSSLVINYTDENGNVHALTYIGKEEDSDSVYYTYRQPKEFTREYISADNQYYRVNEVQCVFTKTGSTIEYLVSENDLFEIYDASQVDDKLSKKQDTLNTTNVPSGTLTEAIGFDANGDIVRGSAGGGKHSHYIRLRAGSQIGFSIIIINDTATPFTLDTLCQYLIDNGHTSTNGYLTIEDGSVLVGASSNTFSAIRANFIFYIGTSVYVRTSYEAYTFSTNGSSVTVSRSISNQDQIVSLTKDYVA